MKIVCGIQPLLHLATNSTRASSFNINERRRLTHCFVMDMLGLTLNHLCCASNILRNHRLQHFFWISCQLSRTGWAGMAIYLLLTHAQVGCRPKRGLRELFVSCRDSAGSRKLGCWVTILYLSSVMTAYSIIVFYVCIGFPMRSCEVSEFLNLLFCFNIQYVIYFSSRHWNSPAHV